MYAQKKNILFFTIASLFVFICAALPYAKASSEQITDTIQTPSSPPSVEQNGKEVKKQQELTPQQQEELKINEDNVMNPFPG